MVRVWITARDVGSRPDRWWAFDLPEVPAIGSYISIGNPDLREPRSEDLIVRHVWWRLFHPGTRSLRNNDEDDETESVGKLTEIFVECDKAIGPYASEHWRKWYAGRSGVEAFNVSRLPLLDTSQEDEPST
jgi:hypothetical protein